MCVCMGLCVFVGDCVDMCGFRCVCFVGFCVGLCVGLCLFVCGSMYAIVR